MDLSIDELRRHIGRRTVTTDTVHPGPANLLRLAFDRQEPEFRAGDALPPGWQCLYFLPQFRPGELTAFHAVKAAFDPQGLLNPGKGVPTLHRCAEFGFMHVHRGQEKFPDLPRF